MNIKELREQIDAIPVELDHLEVLGSIDDEGNGYRSLSGLDSDCFVLRGDVDFIYEESELDEEDKAEAVQYVVIW